MRRTGAVEAQSGGADLSVISQKMANTVASSQALQKTYLPVNRGQSRWRTRPENAAAGESGRTRQGQKLKLSVRES